MAPTCPAAAAAAAAAAVANNDDAFAGRHASSNT